MNFWIWCKSSTVLRNTDCAYSQSGDMNDIIINWNQILDKCKTKFVRTDISDIQLVMVIRNRDKSGGSILEIKDLLEKTIKEPLTKR